MLPTEAQDLLLGHFQNVKQEVPFSPSIFKGSKPDTNKAPNQFNKTLFGRETTENLFR